MHVHIRWAGYEAKVWMDNFEIAYSDFPKKDSWKLKGLALTYEKDIKEKWKAHFKEEDE